MFHFEAKTQNCKFPSQSEIFKIIFFKKEPFQVRNGKFEEWNAKSRIENHRFSKIFKIQSDKTSIGLYGQGGKSNMYDRGS